MSLNKDLNIEKDDRYVNLYNSKQEHILTVRLTEEGFIKYKKGNVFDWAWVEICLDIQGINRAEY